MGAYCSCGAKTQESGNNHILPTKNVLLDSDGNEILDVSPSIEDILKRINC
jgi:hypothetical protein